MLAQSIIGNEDLLKLHEENYKLPLHFSGEGSLSHVLKKRATIRSEAMESGEYDSDSGSTEDSDDE